jgi:hypothetical protein
MQSRASNACVFDLHEIATDVSFFVSLGCGCEGEERLSDPPVRRSGKENGGTTFSAPNLLL